MDSDNKILDTLTTELANVSLSTNALETGVTEPILLNPEDKQVEAKAAFINKMLNPADEKEQKHLEQKLAPTYTDKKKGITKQQKLDKLVDELSHDFDELAELQTQTDFILNEYADANFKPQEVGKSFLSGFLETPEARATRLIKLNLENREKFTEQNREKCLLEALRTEIRHPNTGISSKEIEVLDKEERVQKLLDTPKYQNRVGEHLDTTAKLKPQDFKKHSDLLSVSIQAKSNAKLDSRELFIKGAIKKSPESRTVMFNQFKSSLASAKNQVMDDIEVKAGRKKGFKSLV